MLNNNQMISSIFIRLITEYKEFGDPVPSLAIYIKLLMNINHYCGLLHLTLISLLIINVQTQAVDCSSVSPLYCGWGLCSNYVFVNNKCELQLKSCSQSESFQNGTNACVSCLSLPSLNCTSICPSFTFFRNQPSNYVKDLAFISGCRICQDAFGLGCSSCNITACVSCKSQMTLNSTTSNCGGTLCPNLSSCIVCGSPTTCRLCLQGFQLNLTDMSCASALCKIKYCIKCNGTQCSTCYQGYIRSPNKQYCQPSCPDIHCNSCVQPGVCGGCISGFILNSRTSSCKLDCTANAVSKCYSCRHLNVCDGCVADYHIGFKGTICYPDCTATNCLICLTFPSVCTFCLTGYKLEGFSCIEDSCRIEYCNNCSSINTCQACSQNFIIGNQRNNTCIPACIATIPNCLICQGTQVCDSCYPGYRLTSGTNLTRRCQKICIIQNCQACGSSTTCLDCMVNYALSEDLRTCKLYCIPNCLECSSSTQCRTCQEGFTLSADNISCIQSCPTGQVLVGGTCSSCNLNDGNCLSCRANNLALLCLSCKDGFFLNSESRCTECSTQITNCIKCSGTVSLLCSQCLSPTKLTKGQCISCVLESCEECQIADNSKCAKCAEGFDVQSDGSCVFKQVECPATTLLINGVCSCGPGAKMQGQICVSCTQNCLDCTESICLKCINAYYPSKLLCLQCSPNCISCTSDTNCLVCTSDTSLIGGKCVATGEEKAISVGDEFISCGTGCQSCTLGVNKTVICTKPQDGYNIVGGVIQKCLIICKECSNGNLNHCKSCYQGFALSGQICIPCANNFTLTCMPTNADFSLTCQRGYTTKIEAGKCRTCPVKCLKCDMSEQNKCDPASCESGFTIDETQRCVNCFRNCPFCDQKDPKICLRCDSNRYLNKGVCFKCPINCEDCQSQTKCTKCEPGYVIIRRLNSSQLCYKSPEYPCVTFDFNLQCSNCFSGYNLMADKSCLFNASCNATKTCTSCSHQSFLNFGGCEPCIFSPGCIRCTSNDENACSRCARGFYLDQGNCTICETGCDRCTSGVRCTEAGDGYFLTLNRHRQVTGIIKPCRFPCRDCQNYDYYCLTCVPDYNIIGTNCFSTRAVVAVVSYTPKLLYEESDDKDTKLRKVYNSLYDVKKDICTSLPQSIKADDNQICSRSLIISKITINSINVDFKVDTNSKLEETMAKATILQSIMRNGISNSEIKILSVGTEGYYQTQAFGSSSQQLNIILILAVSIPLSILFVLIVIVAYYSWKKQEEDKEQQSFEKEEVNSRTQMEEIF